MRVVSDNDIPQTLEGGKFLEQKKDHKSAAALYEKLLKESHANLKIITRLLIVYRKLKYYKKEMVLINKAIKIHEQLYLPKKNKAAITAISKKLNRLLGHTDKKGRVILVPNEVLQLQKRKAILEKRYLLAS